MGTRWLAVGQSAEPDSYEAGSHAARAALLRDDPGLLVVFTSDTYDLSELLRGINTESAGTPLIGCSTAGEIATAGPSDASVVVVALGGDGFSISTGCAVARADGLREASADASRCAADAADRPHRVLMLLTDGLGGDQMEVVRGAYSVVGAEVPLVGGCAGDGLKMKATHQLFGDQVLQGAVVAAALGSDAPMGIGVQHGWRKVGDPMLVTASTANRVQTLDDQPALDVYLQRLGAPPEAYQDAAAFTRFAMTHPLGLIRRRREEVRYVAEANFADRSLICIAQVPQAGLAWMMEGDDESVLEATDVACRDALASLDGRPPIGLLAFDCIARRGVLGDEGIRSEIDRITSHAGAAPVAGFYTYGEIARTRGVTGFHNQTLVVLAVS